MLYPKIPLETKMTPKEYDDSRHFDIKEPSRQGIADRIWENNALESTN